MTPMLPTDEDTNVLFDDIVLQLQRDCGMSEVDASNASYDYYIFFTNKKSCESIGVPLQDDDFFFHESAAGMALRVYYYMVLKGDPAPSAFIEWRSSLKNTGKLI